MTLYPAPHFDHIILEGPTVSPLSFGAVGDGVSDDTAAIQAAAAAVPSTGGTLLIERRHLASATILLKSNTRMSGNGPATGLVASAAWPGGTTYQLVLNQNYNASVITDSNIVIENMLLDYGALGPLASSLPPAAAYGATHAVSCRMARNIVVRNCLFQLRGANDATAMIGCDNTLVDGCSAYDASNCAYDHWWGPQNARVVNCYSKSVGGDVVLFNPEPSSGPSTGFVAKGLVVANNEFIITAATAASIFAGPIGTGTFVQDVLIAGNILTNVGINTSGAVTNAIISTNQIDSFVGKPGWRVIGAEALSGSTPSGVVVANNVLTNPSATSSVIVVSGPGAVVVGNVITGTGYGTFAGIDTGAYAATVIGNSVSNGITNTPAALAGAFNLRVPSGGGFSWADNAGGFVTFNLASDNHQALFGTNASGGQRLILDIYQRSNSSALTCSVPFLASGGFGANGQGASGKINITGSRGSATAAVLESLLQALQTFGLVTDSTTA